MYDFIGTGLSLWPTDQNGQLRKESGIRLLSSQIITVLLLKPGEDPLHPELGIAPDLYSSLSGEVPIYFLYKAREVLNAWIGKFLDGLWVDTNKETSSIDNEIRIHVIFQPKRSQGKEVFYLTLGWHEYTGVREGSISMEQFRENIALNGKNIFSIK